jgi:hypothetical protein
MIMLEPIQPRRLPVQDHAKLLLLADRWQRATGPHATWADRAKLAFDFVEGRQWTESQLAAYAAQGRPVITKNKIAPLVRLVLGYHAQNRLETTYVADQDGLGLDTTAEALSKVRKAIAKSSREHHVDTAVFMDGLIGSRGFYNVYIDFDGNDLGEVRVRAEDPFCTYLDPDGDEYDPDTWGYTIRSRMLSIDEIEATFGREAADLVSPWARGQTPVSPITMINNGNGADITPVRAFGSRESHDFTDWWDNIHGLMGDCYDPYRKTVRTLDFEYWVSERKRVFIDLETGDRSIIPDEWSADRIRKVLWQASQIDNPVTVEWRRVRRVRRTQIAGDVTLYDRWSRLDHFSTVGFFPYFRHGQTRGMVDDLIDPQREINKRASAEIEIVSKTGNGGWMYHEKSLSPEQKRLLKRFGAMPGFNLEWKGEVKPERIDPSPPPTAMERLERNATDDLKVIASLNDSATGELDRVQSGRAVEARQRQAVVGQQIYLTNFSLSKELVSHRVLNGIQKYYTEERVIRIMGENGKLAQLVLNQEIVDPASGLTRVLNDVTRGKYSVVIDERPLSATFANGQFEEMMQLLEKLGAAGLPLGAFGDLILDASILPRKQEWIDRFNQIMGLSAGGAPAPGPAGTPGGAPADPTQPPPDITAGPASNVVSLR